MFFEERLNDGLIIYDTVGGGSFLTTVISRLSGEEKRNAEWSKSRGRWEIGERRVTRDELAELNAFFRLMQGRLHGFRFKDWGDYTATSTPITHRNNITTSAPLGIGDGAETDFQLRKQYAVGASAVLRPITKPVSGTVVPYLDGSPLGSGFTVDTTTGIVTFDSAPGGSVVVTADFEFDVPARFDTDQFQSRFDAYDQANDVALHFLFSLPIVELKSS